MPSPPTVAPFLSVCPLLCLCYWLEGDNKNWICKPAQDNFLVAFIHALYAYRVTRRSSPTPKMTNTKTISCHHLFAPQIDFTIEDHKFLKGPLLTCPLPRQFEIHVDPLVTTSPCPPNQPCTKKAVQEVSVSSTLEVELDQGYWLRLYDQHGRPAFVPEGLNWQLALRC